MRYFLRFLSGLSGLIADLFSLLFPRLCCGCSKHLLASEQAICISCLYDLPYTDHHLHADNKVMRLFWGKIPVQAAMALLYFRKGSRVQRMVHQLKYQSRPDMGRVLGRLIGEQMLKVSFHADIDLVIPVPLHWHKERKRGYNQSLILAEGLAAVLNKPLNSQVLRRHQATESQVRKGRHSRHENMRDAFSVTGAELLLHKHVLLVDDVVTTGATLEACAAILYQHGLGRLSIVAAACPA